MKTYYNEFDKNAAEWLRNLGAAGEISQGEVDERSIKAVAGADLAGFRRAHFFAGIGGWDLALRLAGWPEDKEAWTGSCPCQPYSSAGKQKGDADERNLWPDFFRLIAERRPQYVFGEQVASAIKHGWIDRVQADLEGIGYSVGYAVLGAHSVGANHIRQRLYWGAALEGLGNGNGIEADAERSLDERRRDAMGRVIETVAEREPGHDGFDGPSSSVRDADAEGAGGRSHDGAIPVGTIEGLRESEGQDERGPLIAPRNTRGSGAAGGVSDDEGIRPGQISQNNKGLEVGGEGRPEPEGFAVSPAASPWSDFAIVFCTDGKARRTGSRVFPLAHGLPRGVGDGGTWRKGLARSASRARIGMLKGSGNAIVPALAAEFIMALMEDIKYERVRPPEKAE